MKCLWPNLATRRSGSSFDAMGFILIDLEDERNNHPLNNRMWGPYAELIEQAGLLPKDRAELIAYHLCTELLPQDCKAIADLLDDLRSKQKLPIGIDPDRTLALVAFLRSCKGGCEVC